MPISAALPLTPRAADSLEPERPAALHLGGLALVVYLALSLVLLVQILHRNGGQFTYALDDPYIHLALSKGMAHGHYGINPGELSSPSSSVLWPVLLVPFGRASWQTCVPLLLNLAAGMLTAGLIGVLVARWPAVPGGTSPKVEWWRRRVSAVGLVFVGNLLGLTFIGMEHTLQVLLAGIGAWGIVCCLRGKPVAVWVLVCVAVAPMVRYESLGITLAVAMALVGQRQRKRAVAMMVAAVVPLLLFSFFLHSLGLPWLPTSILVKAQSRMSFAHRVFGEAETPAAAAPATEPMRLAEPPPIEAGSDFALVEPHRLLVEVLLVLFVVVAWKERDRVRRYALWGTTAAIALHLGIGRVHWFHRYEVYVVFFGVLVLLHVVHERQRGMLAWYALGLLACSQTYLRAAAEVPGSAAAVYRQQFQMSRFARDFNVGNVAVNDLGLVSDRRLPGTFVLDLYGLGSVEAARQKEKTTGWLDDVTRRHEVNVVMLYQEWFAPPPATWTYLGQVCLNELPVALGEPCVHYYGVKPEQAAALRQKFDAFARTLPDGVHVIRPTQTEAALRR